MTDHSFGANAGDQGRKAYSRGSGGGRFGGYDDDYYGEYKREDWRFETVQLDNRAEYARICQAKGLESRQEDADKFADLVEKGANALEAFSRVHRG